MLQPFAQIPSACISICPYAAGTVTNSGSTTMLTTVPFPFHENGQPDRDKNQTLPLLRRVVAYVDPYSGQHLVVAQHTGNQGFDIQMPYSASDQAHFSITLQPQPDSFNPTSLTVWMRDMSTNTFQPLFVYDLPVNRQFRVVALSTSQTGFMTCILGTSTGPLSDLLSDYVWIIVKRGNTAPALRYHRALPTAGRLRGGTVSVTDQGQVSVSYYNENSYGFVASWDGVSFIDLRTAVGPGASPGYPRTSASGLFWSAWCGAQLFVGAAMDNNTQAYSFLVNQPVLLYPSIPQAWYLSATGAQGPGFRPTIAFNTSQGSFLWREGLSIQPSEFSILTIDSTAFGTAALVDSVLLSTL